MLISSQHRLNNTKKADIRFIRNVAAPKHSVPVKSYSTSNIAGYPSSMIISSNAPHVLTLNLTILAVDNTVHKYSFGYGYETLVGELMQFVKNKMQIEFVYFKSGNFLVDYFLTLEYKLLCDLGLSQLDLVANRITTSQIRQISLKSIEIIKCIGSGGFSKVLLARVLGIIMAVKIIDKQFIFKTAKQTIVENEKLILQQCSGHPFITKLYLTFETNNYIVLGMEYCPGGELFNLLRKVKKMKENDAKFYFIETLLSIEHLHNKGILYRDLKPENIIIDAEGHLRLADFGLSKIIGRNATYSFCGSAEYMSPQMLLKKGHSYEVDYYCLGALLYELVTGLPPFYTQNQGELFHNILNSSVTFPSHAILSASLKSFLIKILEKQPQHRFQSISEILQDPWVAQNFNRQDFLNKKIAPPYPTSIMSYNFDDSQFSLQQQTIFKMLENEADAKQGERQFNGFYYESDQIMKLKSEIEQSIKTNYNFMKNKSISKKQLNMNTHSRNNSIHSQNYNPHLTQSAKNLSIKQLLTRQHDSSLTQATATPLAYSSSKLLNNSKNYESPRQALHPALSLSSPKSGLSSPHLQTIYTNKPRFMPSSPILKASPKPLHHIYSRHSQKSLSKQRDLNASNSNKNNSSNKLDSSGYRNHMINALYGRNSNNSRDHSNKIKDKSNSLDRSYHYKEESYSYNNVAKTRKTIQLNYLGKNSANDSKLNSLNSSHTSNGTSMTNSNKVKKGSIKNSTDKINFQYGSMRNVYHNSNYGK